jgi:membrane protease YdiL (CAAX protease family)
MPLPPPSDQASPPFDEDPAAVLPESVGTKGAPAWPLWVAPAGVVLGLVLAYLATVIVDVIATAGGGSANHLTPAANIIADIVFDLAFVAGALWLVSRWGRPTAAQFGYRPARLSTAVRVLLAGAAGYYGLSYVYAALLNLHQQDKLPSDLGVTHSTAALVAAAVFVCAIAPMAEEFFFRGFFFGTLRNMPIRVGGRNAGPWVAAVLTGILFGFAHLGSAPAAFLVPLGFLGFVLCLIRWRTGSLYPCMALHSANNALALGVNQLSWNAPEIIGLVLASWLVIALVTGPLAVRSVQRA